MPNSRCLAWLLLVPLLLAAAAPARADEQADTTESAILLIRRSMQVHRNGHHNLLLRALRQLGDPELTPLFSELAQSDALELKLHGLLGLAESSPDKKLDLVRVAAMENVGAQAQLIGAAMDAHLVGEEQARQIINWGQIDPAVKLVVAAPLIQGDKLKELQPDLGVLKENLKQDNLARRGVAVIMLLQLGEPGMDQELAAIDKSADPKRDITREMMLQTAYQYEYQKAASWALSVARESEAPERLRLAALRTAMRLGAPGATELWKQRFASASDAADRMKLALEALKLSPWMEPGLYEPLIQNPDPQIKQMGLTGASIALKKNVADSVIALIELGHPIASNWAIGFARKHAEQADAERILLAVIAAAEDGEVRTKAQRLADAAGSVEMLLEVNPQVGPDLVRPILARKDLDPIVAQAILLGLIRSETPAHQAARGLEFNETLTSNLAVVLLAKSGQGLTPAQMRDLSLVVRGGGVKQDAVRIQAAWTYLKLTGQTRDALAKVIGQGYRVEPLPIQNAKP